MSDPYNPFEKEYKLTRGALEFINAHGFGVSIITKSDLIIRDIDVFKKIKEHSPKSKSLWNLFKKECDKFGIIYNMNDIIKAYKSGYEKDQLSLF